MPVTHQSPVFSVDQAKVYGMLTDVTTNPTYSAGVLVSGIKSVAIDPDVLAKELFGDNKIMARQSKTRQLMITVGYAKLDLDVLPVIGGMATADTGVTPNMVATLNLLGSNLPTYFKLEARALNVEVPGPAAGGSINLTFHKCKITKWNVGMVEEDYGPNTFEAACIATISNDKIFTATFNETAAALS